MVKNRRAIILRLRANESVLYTNEMDNDVQICSEFLRKSVQYYELFTEAMRKNDRILVILSRQHGCWSQILNVPIECRTLKFLKNCAVTDMNGFFEFSQKTVLPELLFYVLAEIEKNKLYYYVDRYKQLITEHIKTFSKTIIRANLKQYKEAAIPLTLLPYQAIGNSVSKKDIYLILYEDITQFLYVGPQWKKQFTKKECCDLLISQPHGYPYIPTDIKKQISTDDLYDCICENLKIYEYLPKYQQSNPILTQQYLIQTLEKDL